MKGMVLKEPGAVASAPLRMTEMEKPSPGEKEILIRVKACGVCHTDLHIVEGELKSHKLPVVPGHQIVGIVEEVGKGVRRFKQGVRAGVGWLHHTCGICEFCLSGRENLCDLAFFTGYDTDGGYAEWMLAHEDFAFPIPARFSDEEAAPLLCGGIIGYRAYRLSEVKAGGRLGLYGFGASAHLVLQMALHQGCEVFVFTRSPEHQHLSLELGARWAGRAEETPPALLDSSIIFAPAGYLVLEALRVLKKGGTLALAVIHSSPIPELNYQLLYPERTIKSVANFTRQDAEEFLRLAGESPIRPKIQIFPLSSANDALLRLKERGFLAAAVLVP